MQNFRPHDVVYWRDDEGFRHSGVILQIANGTARVLLPHGETPAILLEQLSHTPKKEAEAQR